MAISARTDVSFIRHQSKCDTCYLMIVTVYKKNCTYKLIDTNFKVYSNINTQINKMC